MTSISCKSLRTAHFCISWCSLRISYIWRVRRFAHFCINSCSLRISINLWIRRTHLDILLIMWTIWRIWNNLWNILWTLHFIIIPIGINNITKRIIRWIGTNLVPIIIKRSRLARMNINNRTWYCLFFIIATKNIFYFIQKRWCHCFFNKISITRKVIFFKFIWT